MRSASRMLTMPIGWLSAPIRRISGTVISPLMRWARSATTGVLVTMLESSG